MNKYVWILGVVCVFGVAGLSALAEEKKTLADVRAELTKLRSDIEKQTAMVNKEAAALFRRQQELEYGTECAVLHKEIVDLEKQLVSKRGTLKELMANIPEMRELEKERRAVFQKLEQMREEERLLLNEIQALENPVIGPAP